MEDLVERSKSLPVDERLGLAFRETKQWVVWQVQRNAQSDVKFEDLRPELQLRLSHASRLIATNKQAEGAGSTDKNGGARPLDAGEGEAGGGAGLFADPVAGEFGFRGGASGGRAPPAPPVEADPYGWGAIYFDTEQTVRGATPGADLRSGQGGEGESGDGEEGGSGDEEVVEYELTYTVIAGRWRTRRRSARGGGTSGGDIYFDAGA